MFSSIVLYLLFSANFRVVPAQHNIACHKVSDPQLGPKSVTEVAVKRGALEGANLSLDTRFFNQPSARCAARSADPDTLSGTI